MRSCSHLPNSDTQIDTVRTTDTLYIHKIIKDTVYFPGETVFIPGSPTSEIIDTFAVLQNFFGKRIYEDSIKIDSFGYVFIRDTVHMNAIMSRHIEGRYSIPIITNATTITIKEPHKPKNQFYIGVDIIGGSKEPISYFGPSILYKNRKDKIYDLGIGLQPDGGIGVKLGMKWKIQLK